MIATILTIIAYLLPLILEGIKGQRETIKGNDHDANVQNFRKALKSTPPNPLFSKEGEPTGGGVDIDAALADQHDRVLAELGGREW